MDQVNAGNELPLCHGGGRNCCTHIKLTCWFDPETNVTFSLLNNCNYF